MGRVEVLLCWHSDGGLVGEEGERRVGLLQGPRFALIQAVGPVDVLLLGREAEMGACGGEGHGEALALVGRRRGGDEVGGRGRLLQHPVGGQGVLRWELALCDVGGE